ncbi:MAG: penicillin-binding transpeptidase domain-containing protein, partial [Bacteroidota bacterium]
AKRQPGSTFKPFVYTAAIANGYSPMTMYPDSVTTFYDAVGTEWRPRNSGESTGQLMSIRDGLAESKNTITAHLISEVGPKESAFYARRMGIQSPLQEVLSLGLGTSDVTLLELASAYGTIANRGLYNPPVSITRIEDRFGNVLYENTAAPTEALSEETAAIVYDMMRDVIQRGTGRRINNVYGLRDYDLAGKTGTTQNSADCWFMMMHPNLVMGSWVGFDDPRVTFATDYWGQGAHSALFLVGDFMREAVKNPDLGLDKDRYPMPEGLGIGIDQTLPPLADPGRSSDDTNQGGRRIGW